MESPMRRPSPRNGEIQRLQKRGAEKEGVKKSKVNYSFPDDRTYDEPHKRSWEPKKVSPEFDMVKVDTDEAL
jgi:hypothetical protein